MSRSAGRPDLGNSGASSEIDGDLPIIIGGTIAGVIVLLVGACLVYILCVEPSQEKKKGPKSDNGAGAGSQKTNRRKRRKESKSNRRWFWFGRGDSASDDSVSDEADREEEQRRDALAQTWVRRRGLKMRAAQPAEVPSDEDDEFDFDDSGDDVPHHIRMRRRSRPGLMRPRIVKAGNGRKKFSTPAQEEQRSLFRRMKDVAEKAVRALRKDKRGRTRKDHRENGSSSSESSGSSELEQVMQPNGDVRIRRKAKRKVRYGAWPTGETRTAKLFERTMQQRSQEDIAAQAEEEAEINTILSDPFADLHSRETKRKLDALRKKHDARLAAQKKTRGDEHVFKEIPKKNWRFWEKDDRELEEKRQAMAEQRNRDNAVLELRRRHEEQLRRRGVQVGLVTPARSTAAVPGGSVLRTNLAPSVMSSPMSAMMGGHQSMTLASLPRESTKLTHFQSHPFHPTHDSGIAPPQKLNRATQGGAIGLGSALEVLTDALPVTENFRTERAKRLITARKLRRLLGDEYDVLRAEGHEDDDIDQLMSAKDSVRLAQEDPGPRPGESTAQAWQYLPEGVGGGERSSSSYTSFNPIAEPNPLSQQQQHNYHRDRYASKRQPSRGPFDVTAENDDFGVPIGLPVPPTASREPVSPRASSSRYSARPEYTLVIPTMHHEETFDDFDHGGGASGLLPPRRQQRLPEDFL